ncbi:MAG: hypothetical protein SGILL_010108, partial [Bacillariaceae sp.]
TSATQFPLQQSNGDRKSPLPFKKNFEPTIEEDENEDSDEASIDDAVSLQDKILDWMDISIWLSKDVVFDEEGVPYFETSANWSIAGVIRWLFYNPFYPEFTSLQQFS